MEVRASVVQAIPSEALPPPQALAIAATASRHKMWTDLLGARAPLVRCSGFATLRLSLLKGSRWTSISTTEMSVSHLCSATNPNGQKTRPSQFPDESHRRQPRAKPLNPACTAAAPGEHDPNAPLCLTSPPTQSPQHHTVNPAPHITGP